jgi:hypothetical protein
MPAMSLKTLGLSGLRPLLFLGLGVSCLLLGWYKLEPRVLRPFLPLSGRQWAKEVEAAVSKANRALSGGRPLGVRCAIGERAELALEDHGDQGLTLVVRYPDGDACWLPRVEEVRAGSTAGSVQVHLGLPRLRTGYRWGWGDDVESNDPTAVFGGLSRDRRHAEPPLDVELGTLTPQAVWGRESEFAEKFRGHYQGKSLAQIRQLIAPMLPMLRSSPLGELTNSMHRDPWELFRSARVLPVVENDSGTPYVVRLLQFRTRFFRRTWNGVALGPDLVVNRGGTRLVKYYLYPSRDVWASEAATLDPAGAFQGISWAEVKGVLSQPPSTFAGISTCRLNLYGRLLATPSESLGTLFDELDRLPGAADELIALLDGHRCRDYYATYEYCYSSLCLLELLEKYPDRGRPGAKALVAALRSAAGRLGSTVRADGSTHRLGGEETGGRSLTLEVFSTLYTLLRFQDRSGAIDLFEPELRRGRIDPAMRAMARNLVKHTQPNVDVRDMDTAGPAPHLDLEFTRALIADDRPQAFASLEEDVSDPEPFYLFWYRLMHVVCMAEWLDDIELNSTQKLPRSVKEDLEGFVFAVLSPVHSELQSALAVAQTCEPRTVDILDAGNVLRPRFARIALHRMIRLIERRHAADERRTVAPKPAGESAAGRD